MSTPALIILFIVMILPGILIVLLAGHLKLKQSDSHQAAQLQQLHPGNSLSGQPQLGGSPMGHPAPTSSGHRELGQPLGQAAPDSYSSRDFSHSFGYYSEVDELILQNRIPQAVRSYRKHARVRLPQAQQAVEQRAHELLGHWN